MNKIEPIEVKHFSFGRIDVYPDRVVLIYHLRKNWGEKDEDDQGVYHYDRLVLLPSDWEGGAGSPKPWLDKIKLYSVDKTIGIVCQEYPSSGSPEEYLLGVYLIPDV